MWSKTKYLWPLMIDSSRRSRAVQSSQWPVTTIKFPANLVREATNALTVQIHARTIVNLPFAWVLWRQSAMSVRKSSPIKILRNYITINTMDFIVILRAQVQIGHPQNELYETFPFPPTWTILIPSTFPLNFPFIFSVLL